MPAVHARAPEALEHVTRACAWLDQGMAVELPTRRGAMTIFRHDSGALAHALAAYGEWAENEIAFLRHFIPPGGTVIDAGAYVGTHSLGFAEAAGPDGIVLAFEAQPESHSLLVNNLVLNDAATVAARLAVLGGPEAPDHVVIPRIDIAAARSFGSTSLQDGPAPAAGHAVAIPSLRLDALALSRCDLLKIDAEGMEPAILHGAADLLARARPVVYAECNSVDAGARVIARLRAAGMEVFLHVVDAFNPDNWRGRRDDIFQGAKEAALLGVPPERRETLARIPPRPVERLAPVATLDDLVAGMLRKPQYARAVFRDAQAQAQALALAPVQA